MNSEQRRQLTELADGLAKVPPHKFDMKKWGKGHLDTATSDFDCQFAGCAIGWAPKLVKGWKLGFHPRYINMPYYDDQTDYDAVALYLGISQGRAVHLFSPTAYNGEVTPARVATRIHGFLEENR